MPKDKLKLSDRHRQVIDNYYGEAKFNKNQALRMAGYAHPNKAQKVFARPEVVAEMERREVRVRGRYEITYDSIVGELAKLAFSSIADFAEITEDGGFVLTERTLALATPEELAALGEVTVETHWEGRGDDAEEVRRIKIKPWNKLQALEMIMRHAGLSKEKTPMSEAASLVDRILAARQQVSATPAITEEKRDED